MASALVQLLGLTASPDRYDVPAAELRALQLEAVAERFEQQRGLIPLLAQRADSAGLTGIRQMTDLVPLLFAHSTYKTYAEPWLLEGQWNRMARWLGTVTAFDAGSGDFGDVTGLDEWVQRLEDLGFFVACSSGTTGKPAMLGATDADLTSAARSNVVGMAWATGIAPAQDRKFMGLGPSILVAKNERTRLAMIEAYGSPTEEPYQLPVPPISIGSVMAMILLRRRIADGTASPTEVAEFERLSAERGAGMEAAQEDAVEALIKAREQKLLIAGFFPHLYPLAAAVRDRGYTGADFRDDNTMMTGGGLKGVQLPPDYRDVILGTFGLAQERFYHFYSMQEINTTFPKCRAGRYHVAPWVILLPLDAPGETLLDASEGEIEARAAFVDLSLSGRWGGVISGDKVRADARPCACGHGGPTIADDIVRYADLEGGDKISCAGTIDAYVRGVA